MESRARAVIAVGQNEAHIRRTECKTAHKKGAVCDTQPPQLSHEAKAIIAVQRPQRQHPLHLR